MDEVKEVATNCKRVTLENGRIELIIDEDVPKLLIGTKKYLIDCSYMKREDWRIVEEKKSTFIEELREAYKNRCFGDILDVVKQANKEFIVRMNEIGCCSDEDIEFEAKEIFGDRLVPKWL